ncbi:TPA: IS4 family transposase, partial [Pseudomonas aeruginosa]|nr:IS4 family transposase [Pseudomonas aeruginosa]
SLSAQRIRVGKINLSPLWSRPKPYPLLTCTRLSARAVIKKHGHPKRVK